MFLHTPHNDAVCTVTVLCGVKSKLLISTYSETLDKFIVSGYNLYKQEVRIWKKSFVCKKTYF